MPFTYILSNVTGSVYYVGSANDIVREITEQRTLGQNEFVAKFNLNRLVFVEEFETIEEAKQREEQLNTWRRSKKLQLIQEKNPHWEDLFQKLLKS